MLILIIQYFYFKKEAKVVPLTQLFSNSFLRDLDKIWALREYIPDPTKPQYSVR